MFSKFDLILKNTLTTTTTTTTIIVVVITITFVTSTITKILSLLPPHLAKLQQWKMNIFHQKAHKLLPTCMMKDYNHLLNHMNSRHNNIIFKIIGTIRNSSGLAEKT